MKAANAVFIALCALGAAGAAAAQPSGVLLDQNRADRAPPGAPAPAAAPSQAKGRAEVASATPADSRPLTTVEVTGSSLPPAQLQGAVRPLIGKPIDRAVLSAAANAVAGLYGRSEVALYTVEVPAQDFAGGRLRMRVIEGRVSQVAIQRAGGSRATPLIRAYAAPLPEQRPLRRSALERQISLMRDVPGLTLEPQFLQGTAAGDVVLGLKTQERRSDLSLGLTNRGTRQLGRQQAQGALTGYGLLRPGDSTTLTVAVPTQVERLQYASLAHGTPLGERGLRLQGSAAYLRTKPEGAGAAGHAVFGSLQLSYPVIRSYRRNLYLTAAVDGVDSSDASFGRIASNERTAAGRLAAVWSDERERRALVASATASAGSARLSGAIAGAADRGFTKLNLRGGVDQAIGKRLIVRAKATAQLTGSRLPASELMSLGGDEFGRAFEASALIGDSGEAGSLELAWRVGEGAGRLRGSELYALADGGRVRVASRFGLPGTQADLASLGLGARTVWKQKAVLTLEAARAVSQPAGLHQRWRFGFNLRVKRWAASAVRPPSRRRRRGRR